MRSVLRAAGAVAAGAALLMAPVPAHADGEYIRVTPSTIQAGYQVEIEAFCGDNVNPATVKSDAFGVVTITPMRDPANPSRYVHRGTATIPGDKRPRAYPVTMTCPSNQSATTTLHVVNYTAPSRGPKTGGGYLASQTFDGGDAARIGAGVVVMAAGMALLMVARRRRT